MEILVVDDNREICKLVENILVSEGYHVTSCIDPLKFGEIIEKEKPELIITDLMMAGYDGRTLTKEIKTNPVTQNIKVIMMSAHDDVVRIGTSVGADDILKKPFEIDELVGKVQNLLT